MVRVCVCVCEKCAYLVKVCVYVCYEKVRDACIYVVRVYVII